MSSSEGARSTFRTAVCFHVSESVLTQLADISSGISIFTPNVSPNTPILTQSRASPPCVHATVSQCTQRGVLICLGPGEWPDRVVRPSLPVLRDEEAEVCALLSVSGSCLLGFNLVFAPT